MGEMESPPPTAVAAVVRETCYTDHHLSGPHTRSRGSSAASSFEVISSWDNLSGSDTTSKLLKTHNPVEVAFSAAAGGGGPKAMMTGRRR